ncbi:uncharacterized protein [Hetaerina americana]|uniref:uncharacterized protein n=1 Tax=Hetaerina americana TaxID=62018 RepID=UPI003A7F3EEC
MTRRLICIASSFAAAAFVYKADKYVQRRTGKCDTCFRSDEKKEKIKNAIEQARERIQRLKNEIGAPAIVVGVSVNGEVVWKEGVGFSDLENKVPAHEDTVMRIASISKCITAAMVGRLWQEGIIDIDQPIQKYVPSFPEKTFGDEKVTITTRQLMCHLSGIRHYTKLRKDNAVGSGDGQLEEFYGKERYETTEKALSIFKNDDLLHRPGSKYLYTTYGWTVVSAVMEGATGKTYPQLLRAFLREIGMRKTYLDEPEPNIYGRSKCYGKNKNGRIINSPYVDNSCKWAGGGILSTVGDLLTFANVMLYAFQFGGFLDISKATQVVGVVKGKTTRKSTSSQQKVIHDEKTSKGNDANLLPTSKNIGKDNQVVATMENDEKIGSQTNLDGMQDVGSQAGTAVKSMSQGVASAGSYVWDQVWSMIKKEGEGEKEKENSVSKVDKIKDIGSQAGTAVKSVSQGVTSAGSYVWDQVWSMIKKEGEGEKEKENSVSKVDKIKDIGSQAGTAVKSVSQGVASAGSYVWNKALSMIEKEEVNDKEKENSVSKVDKIKDIGSQAGTVVKSVSQGVASAGSYVWNKALSMIEKEEVNDKEKENSVSKVDKIKDIGSQAGTAVKSVSQGVASAGSYASDIMQPKSGNEIEKEDRRVEKTADSSLSKESRLSSIAGYIREETASNGKVTDDKLGNVKMFHYELDSTGRLLCDKMLPVQEVIHQGILLKKIIPTAVNVILGYRTVISEEEDICDADIIETIDPKPLKKPYISQNTIATLWTRVENSKFSDWGPHVEGGYGLGFAVAPAVDSPGGVDDGGQPFMIGHTGGAVGASSAFIVMPRDCEDSVPPKGVAVVILTNLQSVSLNALAIEIAKLFSNVTQ